jgi:hypothetical protein
MNICALIVAPQWEIKQTRRPGKTSFWSDRLFLDAANYSLSFLLFYFSGVIAAGKEVNPEPFQGARL